MNRSTFPPADTYASTSPPALADKPAHNAFDRRAFVSAAFATTLSTTLLRAAESGRAPRLLLRSSWQTINIGDIAHTPGLLAILERYLPQAQIYLWPSRIDNGVDEILRTRFPKLNIVQGTEALKSAFDQCDFLLHGSGPSLVAERDVVRWSTETQKPYGVYGITLPLQSSSATRPVAAEAFAATIDVLSGAEFVYFRDSVSLQVAKDHDCTCPIMEFGPDAAFATDLRDDTRAVAFLEQHGLQEGQFLCCIPRMRYTPNWTIPGSKATVDTVKHARNQLMKEHDHAPHRQAITDVVKQTDLKVLICPEDRTQMAVGKEMLYDPLPDDVKRRVVWRPDYWLTGEAISTYVRSVGLFGNEMHSPIMCIGNGIPAIVCRWAEQTSKGYMWRDIGLQDWLFDFDNEADVARLPAAVLALAQDPVAAQAKAAAARQFVQQRQQATMETLQRSLDT